MYQNSIDKIVLFDYQEGRGREGPVEILKDFTGYLQTDGYVAYDVFAKRQGITLIHCMAHARRMFNDALGNDEACASYAMKEIQKLYAIERRCRESKLSFEEIKAIRQAESVPILVTVVKWRKGEYVNTLPKTAIGKALAYSIERWERLSLYTENGMLNIDNNPLENSIRPLALGRKNYLFAGSHEADKKKRHVVFFTRYLQNVLHRIADHPINQIQDLLPHRYKK